MTLMANWFPERCSHLCSLRATSESLVPMCRTIGCHCIWGALANFKPGYRYSFRHSFLITNYTHVLCRYSPCDYSVVPVPLISSDSLCLCVLCWQEAWFFCDGYCDSYSMHSHHKRTCHGDLCVLTELWQQGYCLSVYDYIKVLYFQMGPSLPWLQSLKRRICASLVHVLIVIFSLERAWLAHGIFMLILENNFHFYFFPIILREGIFVTLAFYTPDAPGLPFLLLSKRSSFPLILSLGLFSSSPNGFMLYLQTRVTNHRSTGPRQNDPWATVSVLKQLEEWETSPLQSIPCSYKPLLTTKSCPFFLFKSLPRLFLESSAPSSRQDSPVFSILMHLLLPGLSLQCRMYFMVPPVGKSYTLDTEVDCTSWCHTPERGLYWLWYWTSPCVFVFQLKRMGSGNICSLCITWR